MKTGRHFIYIVAVCSLLSFGGCVIAAQDATGRKFDESRDCWNKLEVIDRQWEDTRDCKYVSTLAVDSEGNCWLLNSSCMPDDFEAKSWARNTKEFCRSVSLFDKPICAHPDEDYGPLTE